MDIIKPIIITVTIPVILVMGGICLLLIGIDYMHASYQGYFFSNSSD